MRRNSIQQWPDLCYHRSLGCMDRCENINLLTYQYTYLLIQHQNAQSIIACRDSSWVQTSERPNLSANSEWQWQTTSKCPISPSKTARERKRVRRCRWCFVLFASKRKTKGLEAALQRERRKRGRQNDMKGGEFHYCFNSILWQADTLRRKTTIPRWRFAGTSNRRSDSTSASNFFANLTPCRPNTSNSS